MAGSPSVPRLSGRPRSTPRVRTMATRARAGPLGEAQRILGLSLVQLQGRASCYSATSLGFGVLQSLGFRVYCP